MIAWPSVAEVESWFALLLIAVNPLDKSVPIARYLEVKAKKRSWKDDQRNLHRLREAFGAERPLREVTAGRIAEYKIQRARTLVQHDGEPREISAATLTHRHLAALPRLRALQRHHALGEIHARSVEFEQLALAHPCL